MASTSTAAPVVVLDDDDDVQVCSPQCKRDDDPEEDFLQLRLGVSGAKISKKRARSKTRQHRLKRVHPEVDIDLTSNDDCECQVVYETQQQKKPPAAPPVPPAANKPELAKEVSLTCSICFETMKNETSTVCGHIFCSGCILSAIKAQKKCPTCRKALSSTMVHRIYLCGEKNSLSSRKRKCVLSIDGGGVRGLIAVQVLEHLEKCLQDLDGPNVRIADYFDMISGTSTGGLIALMLAAPNKQGRPMFTAKQITEFYLKNSSTIFPYNMFTVTTGLFGPKYSPEPLERLLKSYLGDLRIENTIVPVLIPTFDMKLQQPVIFTTAEAMASPSKNALLRDVARGTSAAPTYFPPAEIETNGVKFNLVDGGLAANNPTFLAIVETFKESGSDGRMTPRSLFQRFEDLLVMSLGCGNQTVSYTANEAARWGALSWMVHKNGPPIINMLLNASSDIVDYTMSALFQLGFCEDNFLRIQTSSLENATAQVDNSTPENLGRLVSLGKLLLKEPVQRINLSSGSSDGGPDMETNDQATLRFARGLSIERRKRQ